MKFLNKYRIESIRFKYHDYSSNGAYFITICTKNRGHYFGEIKNGKMEYSIIGFIAKKYWEQISNHFDFISLDEYIIMPDHIHGIVLINKPMEKCHIGVETRHGVLVKHPQFCYN